MIVILDHSESILEFIDDSDASVEITDTYQGYKSLDFSCELTDVKMDQNLYRQGNKLLLENVLFVINTEVEFDYVHNSIKLEAEELVYEMNNCEPFYVGDYKYQKYAGGNTVHISKNFLTLLFEGFYIVDSTDLALIEDSLRLVTVNGTITKYKLLKEIESTTGLVFKYTYTFKDNTIVKKVSLLKPENYGVTHNKLLERVTIGENTNKLEYNSDETKNALGIMPIITSESNSNVDYTKILKQFYELDINNENIMPYFENYAFSRSDIIAAAKKLYAKIGVYKFLPESVTISHEEIFDMTDYEYVEGAQEDETGAHNGSWPEDKIYTLEIGIGQFLDLATQIVLDTLLDEIPLRNVKCPNISNHSSLNAVFSIDDIFDLAMQIQNHIEKSGECNPSISTPAHGLVSFQWLVLIFAEYLTTSKKVVCKTTDYPAINKILPEYIEENIKYIVDYENYESMPYIYSQNTSDSSNIPTVQAQNTSLSNVLDIEKYISETYPILVVKKTAGATELYVKVYVQGIADKTQNSFFIAFKGDAIGTIKDDSNITIDFSKQTITYTKREYVETTTTKEVEKTVEVQNQDTITATGKNTCGCCGYPRMAYKNYTRTYKNYCPNCKRSGTLVFGPKNVVDGEITCGNTGPACRNKGTVNGKAVTTRIRGCDADYCVQCGGDKAGRGKCARVKLTPAEATTTTTEKETVTETTGEWKESEVTASNDETGDSENKSALSDIITDQSKFEAFYGDCSIEFKGCSFVSLNSDSCKLYELSPFPYIKKAGEQFIYAPITKASFFYTHMSNDNPKLEPFETSEQSVEEVLIGCWKKLNGSGDNTKWLDKSEDINIDLTEENIDFEAGDFVYIKLPDTSVFKAQITEKKYDPKIKSDSSLKIGNVTRESIL